MPRLIRGIDKRGLVLYLPLYKLDGNSFMDRSAYGHLCTVTGATWGSRGRTFNGTQYITIPHNAVFNFGTGDFTWIVWFKTSGTDSNRRILSKGDAAGFLYRISSNTLAGFVGGTGLTAVAFTDILSFHYLTILRISGVVKVLLDLVEKSSDTAAGNVNDANNLTVGIRHDLSEGYAGIIGEVRAYNRGLSLSELTQNYLATKRRCPWYR